MGEDVHQKTSQLIVNIHETEESMLLKLNIVYVQLGIKNLGDKEGGGADLK